MCAAAAVLVLSLISFSAQAWTLKILHNFCTQVHCTDGSTPLTGLVRDSAGNLYGTTEIGGTSGDGVAFELSPNGNQWSYKVLHDFCYACGDGAFPGSALIRDVHGNLYGTTEAAGPNNMRGIVFRLTPQREGSWKEKILHVFTGAPDGYLPVSRLTYRGATTGALYDGVSPLFGNTGRGGASDRGAIYELAPVRRGWKVTVVYDFCPAGGNTCSDGDNPSGDMTLDTAGSLYGLTAFGGANGDGAAYRLSPNVNGTRWHERVLYSFCSVKTCTNGSIPQGPITIDGMGHLFGTTTADAGEGGVVFKLAKTQKTWRETVLHIFCTGDCTDGYLPAAGVMLEPAGHLFGTNEIGGPASLGGTVFELEGSKFATVYNFCSLSGCADGETPQGPLIMDESGNLYGTTAAGGAQSSAGTVFELSP